MAGQEQLVEHLAKAICDGFWETCEYRERWETTPAQKREVFRICARRAIEAGREFKDRMTSQSSKRGRG